VRWEHSRRRPVNSSPEHFDVLIVGAGKDQAMVFSNQA
jgi:hypothetical protein